MRRTAVRSAVGAALAGGLALPMVAAGAAHAAQPAWASTATSAEPTGGLSPLGTLAPAAPLHLTVALGERNQAALRQVIASRQAITPAQFLADYAPTAASVSEVVSYLRAQGFTAVTPSANRLLVTAQATAAQATAAFHTALSAFSLAGRRVFANTAAAEVPSDLAGTVVAVLGLNDLPAERTLATNPPVSCALPGIGYPCTYNPQGFWKAYDANSASTGSATPIAIFAEGDVSGVVADLRTEESANGLPQVRVTLEATGPASSDTTGSDEWDLDTQYSTGMAGTVSQLYLYDAPSLSDTDLTTEFNDFVSQDVAKAASASFGECEFQAELDGSMAADDAIFAAAAAQGQTVFASAGDTGGFCPVGAAVNGVPLGAPDVNYPASSPYVVGVGGTTLVTNSDGSYSNETAWYSGGGGPSLLEKAPSWQAGDGVTGATGVRTVPDVAMDADPNSGANVYVAGTPTGVGGTSLSSPLALGVWARLQTAAGNSLGFAAPRLYAAGGSQAYHDIVLGAALPYPATPGYDLATGLGTFDVANAQHAIG